jgi:hypothetical protein
MDRDKFESFLKNSALFFCRADKFIDPFEGSLPKREADFRIKDAKKIEAFFGRPFDQKLEEKNIRELAAWHKEAKKATIVNCWHINNNESDAMWRLYLKDNEGVAVQTTSEKIKLSIESCTEEIEYSRVQYLDYDTDIWHHPIDYPHTHYNLITPLIHKRLEFKHENEFRLYQRIDEAEGLEDFWNTQEFSIGKMIQVDIEILVDKIIFPPTSDEASQNKIMNLCKMYGYQFNYYKSALNQEPIY